MSRSIAIKHGQFGRRAMSISRNVRERISKIGWLSKFLLWVLVFLPIHSVAKDLSQVCLETDVRDKYVVKLKKYDDMPLSRGGGVDGLCTVDAYISESDACEVDFLHLGWKPIDFNGDKLVDLMILYPHTGDSENQYFELYVNCGDGTYLHLDVVLQ